MESFLRMMSSGNKYCENFISIWFKQYIDFIDGWLMFFSKNREVVDFSRNSQVDNFNAYMKGYTQAKEDYNISYINKEPANVYF